MPKERTDPKHLAVYLSSNYAQLQGLIKQADTKANILIALIGVIISMFFNFFMSNSEISLWQIIIILSIFLISGIFALSTLYPRVSKPTGNFSLTYFKDAQYIDPNKWTNKFLTENQEELITKDLMNNIKEISKILDKKFTKLRFAYILLGIGILIKSIFETIIWFS